MAPTYRRDCRSSSMPSPAYVPRRPASTSISARPTAPPAIRSGPLNLRTGAVALPRIPGDSAQAGQCLVETRQWAKAETASRRATLKCSVRPPSLGPARLGPLAAGSTRKPKPRSKKPSASTPIPPNSTTTSDRCWWAPEIEPPPLAPFAKPFASCRESPNGASTWPASSPHWERNPKPKTTPKRRSYPTRLVPAHELWGALALNRGDFEIAIRELQTAIKLNPPFPKAEYELGLALYSKGDTQAAIPHVQQAAKQGSPEAAQFLQKLTK